jgi:hypothetical protein
MQELPQQKEGGILMSETCQKCGKTMDDKEFYTYRDGSKTELCKKCLTMHVDNFDESTFVWILEKLDIPYVPEEWNVLRDRAFAKDPAKMTGMSVLGRYISKMRLKQWKEYTWADSEKLCNLNAEKREAAKKAQELQEAKVKQLYEEGEVSEAEYKTLTSVPTQIAETPPSSGIDPVSATFYNEDNYMKEEDLPDPGADLTQDDKLYLAMKWGRLYKPNQWIALEKHYNEMINSFDIQDADTTNTLILLCKTYLKMNEAIDVGDFETYQKLSRVYDSMRKSAKFTAAQNKEQKGDFVDSIGAMVAYCEKEGGQIPKFEIKAEADVIDTIINDNKQYYKSLIYQDTALAKQIEDYIKKREILADMEKKEKDSTYVLSDEDMEENFYRIQEEKEQDQKMLEGEEE